MIYIWYRNNFCGSCVTSLFLSLSGHSAMETQASATLVRATTKKAAAHWELERGWSGVNVNLFIQSRSWDFKYVQAILYLVWN